MELSDFLHKKLYIQAPAVPPMEALEWKYERYFRGWLRKYPQEQHDEIRERLQYIKSYATLELDFDGEEWDIPITALRYYDKRGKFLDYTNLSEEAFDKFELLQTEISNLGLSSKATFEFINYLWYFLTKRLNNGSPLRLGMELRKVVERIDEFPQDNIEMDIKVGKKHFKFTNDKFIKSVIAAYLNSDNAADMIEEKEKKTFRELNYIFVRTLLTYLPIKHKKEKKGMYTQSERYFALYVLWLTGGINHKLTDDPQDYCCNAIFDKLMRDFKDTPLPNLTPTIF